MVPADELSPLPPPLPLLLLLLGSSPLLPPGCPHVGDVVRLGCRLPGRLPDTLPGTLHVPGSVSRSGLDNASTTCSTSEGLNPGPAGKNVARGGRVPVGVSAPDRVGVSPPDRVGVSPPDRVGVSVPPVENFRIFSFAGSMVSAADSRGTFCCVVPGCFCCVPDIPRCAGISFFPVTGVVAEAPAAGPAVVGVSGVLGFFSGGEGDDNSEETGGGGTNFSGSGCCPIEPRQFVSFSPSCLPESAVFMLYVAVPTPPKPAPRFRFGESTGPEAFLFGCFTPGLLVFAAVLRPPSPASPPPSTLLDL